MSAQSTGLATYGKRPRVGAHSLRARDGTKAITLTVPDTSRATGLGMTTIYKLLAEGVLQGTKIGRRRLVFGDSVRKLLEDNRDARGAT